MRASSDPINELRRAIDRLPVTTREAMLEGIRENTIVAGAYTDDRGGICPMLAAHRSGSRVDYLPFARSWDAFSKTRRVRRATRREVRVLERMLVDSLDDPGDLDLGAAIAEHQAMRRRDAERAAATDREFGEIVARRLKPARVERLHAQFEAERERAEEALRS